MINILYNELVNLRDNGQLVPEQSYRITDYVCTTTTTDSQAVNNLFDIVVTALDENTLSENASAAYHEGDIYFENARLESWELKYCLDNDINRFDWADNVNGKGVIYYMKDKWGNECPYDFKNIQYLKNSVWVYTFGGATDNSLIGGCHHNKINPYISSNKQTLNNITFGNSCYSNTFGNDCYNITFGNNCMDNIFGNNCMDNIFGDDCYNNTFWNNSYSNTFGNNCMDNTFVTDYWSNTFGDYCYFNTFGNNCNNNTFGDYCNSNTFGNNCNNNTFGIDCSLSTFGDDCWSNAFYDGLSGTTPKNYIRYIVLEDGVSNNNFYSDVTTSSESYLQRIKISGLENDTPTDTIITLPATNTKHEWVIESDENNNNVIQNYPDYLVDAPSDGFLYGRKDGDWEEIDTSGGISIISLTYTELKNLRDNGQLVPGQSYRITDYVTTTTQTDTQSAGNVFDIIVTSLDENTLSENASAVQHDGDTYFSSNNANLESWELKYCLDNDTNRFAWADSVNGKGVIYYMKDENNNELPYDFKNIQFMKDSVLVYTFGGEVDNSLTGGCHHNKINPYIFINKQTLNNNTFGTGCYSNTFWTNCYSNTFGNGCYSNTFGDSCMDNTFGNNFYSNTFGNICQTNTFGIACKNNTFGNDCFFNKFGDYCHYNTFGNHCYNNTFGNACKNNTFGNNCYLNNFYHGSSGTTKKDYIRYIVLEDGVNNNNFYSNLITSDTAFLQRIRIKGLENETPTDIIITLPTTNTDYEWVIAKNSSGVVKQYCPENLVS